MRPGTHGCVDRRGHARRPVHGAAIRYVRGHSRIDIDHVVALGDAWQMGAARWTSAARVDFANDPLDLLAVSASANRQKGDADAASWLPRTKAFRCTYVARQVAVKLKYRLAATAAERAAMRRVLRAAPRYPLPAAGAPAAVSVSHVSATPAGRGGVRTFRELRGGTRGRRHPDPSRVAALRGQPAARRRRRRDRLRGLISPAS